MDLAKWTQFCRMPGLIDYERPGRGLLLAAGSGIMMAVMDVVPRLRWCLDLDGVPFEARARFASWAAELGRFVEPPIGLVGGWAVTRPEWLAAGLMSIRRLTVVYPIVIQDADVFAQFPALAADLATFVAWLEQGSATALSVPASEAGPVAVAGGAGPNTTAPR